MNVIGTFRIGEDISIALDAVSGDPATVTSITAAMKAGVPQRPDVAPDLTQASIPMVVTSRAAAGDVPAGWNLTLPASQSAALEPRTYSIDARLVFASGAVDITDSSAIISLTGAALG